MNRQIWMFPRNKRRMMPLDTALILRAMVVASNLGESWVGEQGQQDEFSELLNQYGLKTGGQHRDRHSGGARTYEAQLRSLGFIYKDVKTNELKLTHAGDNLINLVDTAKTFEYQILKYQYPSEYSLGRNVNLDPDIKIRPFLFLLKLAHDPELYGLSDKDIMIPVVFGKNFDSFAKCKELILKSREFGIEDIIPDDESIRTIKTLNKTYSERIRDIQDIANTFKNVLQGAGLVNLMDVEGDIRVFPREDVVSRFSDIEALPFVDFINLPKEQAFLQYGKRIGAIKDTRRQFMPSKKPEIYTKNAVIYKKFLDKVEFPASQDAINAFIKEIANEYNIDEKIVFESLQDILSNLNGYTGAHLINLSKGGPKFAEKFEKTVANVFSNDFGYSAEWTGRKKSNRVGGFMDVFVIDLGRNECGIIDTKSMPKYSLPHDDVAKAKSTYVDGARELYGSKNLELKFIAYISHIIADGANKRALDIYKDKNISVNLISAYGLNSMRANTLYQNNAFEVTKRLTISPVNLITN